MNQKRNEIFPEEDHGYWVHLFGPTCWCNPFMLGDVLVHRPQAECESALQKMLVTGPQTRSEASD